MKNKNKEIYLLFHMFFIMLLTGCSTLKIASPVELLSKPKLNLDQQAISDLIISSIPHNAYVARPISSNSLSSTGFTDIDYDGNNEIYAFFVDKSNMNVGVIILKDGESGWGLSTDVDVIGTDIAYASFVDLDTDGIQEFVLGTTGEDAAYKNIIIAKYIDGEFKIIYRDFYTEIVIDDFDNDDISEIAIFKLDRNNFAYAEILSYSDDEFKVVAKAELDPYISGYYNILYTNIIRDKKAFVLDFETGSRSATNILLYEDSVLRRVFDSFETDEQYKKTLKLDPIKSADIDNDGIVEIANNFVIDAADSNYKGASGFVAWNNYDTERFKLNNMFFVGNDGHLKIQIPDLYVDLIDGDAIEWVENTISNRKKDYALYIYMDLGNEYSTFMSLHRMIKSDYYNYVKQRREFLIKANEEKALDASEPKTEQSNLNSETKNEPELKEDRNLNDGTSDLTNNRIISDESIKNVNELIREYNEELGIIELDLDEEDNVVYFIQFYDIHFKQHGIYYSSGEILNIFANQRQGEVVNSELSVLLSGLNEFIRGIDFIYLGGDDYVKDFDFRR